MYSRSLHHSGDFELSARSPFFCATKHLSSKFDAILKLDLVWGFIEGFVLFILLSARKKSVHGASSSSSAGVQPDVPDTASNWKAGLLGFLCLYLDAFLKLNLAFYFAVAPETPYSFFYKGMSDFPLLEKYQLEFPAEWGQENKCFFSFYVWWGLSLHAHPYL